MILILYFVTLLLVEPIISLNINEYDTNQNYWNYYYKFSNNQTNINSSLTLYQTKSYQINCGSTSPQLVDLTIYNTDSMISLLNNGSYYANNYSYCYDLRNYNCFHSSYYGWIDLTEIGFENLNSITCGSTAVNPLLSLSNSVSIDVEVLETGNISILLELAFLLL